MAMPKQAKVTRRDEIMRKIASLEAMGPTNTAAVTEIMKLKEQLSYIDAESRMPQEPATAATSQEHQAAAPYSRIGASGFFKGPERMRGPATPEQDVAAKPYEQIGQSGFFKGPAKVEAVQPVAPVAPIEPEKAVVPEKAYDGVYPPPPELEEIAPKDKPGPDWGGIAKKLGVSALELVNAFAMGQAGVTDTSQLAYGQRLAREAEDKQLEAAQDQAQAEMEANALKAELDRKYQAEQQRIQNEFTVSRDARAATTSKAAADEAYQHELGLINAQLTEKKAAAAPEWVKKITQKGPPAKAAEKKEPAKKGGK
jgi:hypothetical protein